MLKINSLKSFIVILISTLHRFGDKLLYYNKYYYVYNHVALCFG